MYFELGVNREGFFSMCMNDCSYVGWENVITFKSQAIEIQHQHLNSYIESIPITGRNEMDHRSNTNLEYWNY